MIISAVKVFSYLRTLERVQGWRAYACAALLGVLAAAALPPFSLAPLLFIAIPGLLALAGGAPTAKAAGLRGLVFGLFHHLAGLYWVTNAVLVMAAEFWWAVPITVPLLALVLALFIAMPCALARRVPAGWPRLLLFAGLYVGGDLVREFLLSGFPWNLLASATEMPGTLGLVFMQPAGLLGAHGLTFAVLLVSGGFGLSRRSWLVSVAGLGVWAAAGALLLGRAAPATGLAAIIVQGNVPETEHRDHWLDPAWSAGVFKKYLATTHAAVAAAKTPIALVIWPETASPYDLVQEAAARRAIAAAASPAPMVLAGTVTFEAPRIAHNSLAAIASDGSLSGLYEKAHLVPWGEYVPAYGKLVLGEQGFTPGPGLVTLHLPGLPAIGPLICYEAIFPSQVANETDHPGLLVNITNDSWFGNSAGPRQHLAAARLRAVEEGLPLLRAANTGISAIIDAHGRILASLPLNKTGTLNAAIPGALPRTPASFLGLMEPALLALLSCLAALLLPKPRSRA